MGSILVTDAPLCSVLLYSILFYSILFYSILFYSILLYSFFAVMMCFLAVRISDFILLDTLAPARAPAPTLAPICVCPSPAVPLLRSILALQYCRSVASDCPVSYLSTPSQYITFLSVTSPLTFIQPYNTHSIIQSFNHSPADWCADSNLTAPIAVRSFRTTWDDSCAQTHLNLGECPDLHSFE